MGSSLPRLGRDVCSTEIRDSSVHHHPWLLAGIPEVVSQCEMAPGIWSQQNTAPRRNAEVRLEGLEDHTPLVTCSLSHFTKRHTVS